MLFSTPLFGHGGIIIGVMAITVALRGAGEDAGVLLLVFPAAAAHGMAAARTPV